MKWFRKAVLYISRKKVIDQYCEMSKIFFVEKNRKFKRKNVTLDSFDEALYDLLDKCEFYLSPDYVQTYSTYTNHLLYCIHKEAWKLHEITIEDLEGDEMQKSITFFETIGIYFRELTVMVGRNHVDQKIYEEICPMLSTVAFYLSDCYEHDEAAIREVNRIIKKGL